MSLRFKFEPSTPGFLEEVRRLNRPVAEAATKAMREAGEIAKKEGRATIAAAGFSKRWQNTLRVDVFPSGKKISVNPAANVYHKIPYAGVFEEGAEIRGKPKLWLPLPSLAVKRVDRKKVTPKLIQTLLPSAEKLQTIKRGGKPPLLAVKVRLSKAKADASQQSITAADIRRGAGKGAKNGRVVSVPIFHGLDSVNIRKKFNVYKVCRDVRDRLAQLYYKNFRGD